MKKPRITIQASNQPDLAEIEAKRIRRGLCPKCGTAVETVTVTAEGVAEAGEMIQCPNKFCTFEITNGVWYGTAGYCVIYKEPQK